MLARAENRKGNVVSKMNMYNRTIFMLKYMYTVLFDGRSTKQIQVHAYPQDFYISLHVHLHVYETHIVLYEWVRDNLFTVDSFIFVGCFPCLAKKKKKNFYFFPWFTYSLQIAYCTTCFLFFKGEMTLQEQTHHYIYRNKSHTKTFIDGFKVNNTGKERESYL